MWVRRMGLVAVVVASVSGCSGEPVQVDLTVRPIKLLADGRATAELFVTVTDSAGAPVTGAAVTFWATAATIVIDAGGVTDDMGKARATLRGTSPGDVTVHANVLGQLVEGQVALVAVAPPCPVDQLYNVATAGVGSPQVADLDGDGDLDLVGVDERAGIDAIRIALGNGDGSFLPPAILDHPGAIRLAAGDVDGDGVVDLVVGGYKPPELSFRRGIGDGSFGDPVAIALTPEVNASIALADLDGDAALDLWTRGQDSLAVAYGGGDGSFASFVAIPFSGQIIRDLVARDLDQDGRTDLVAISGPALHVVLGRADRVLTETTYPKPAWLDGAIAVAELTDDAHLDVAHVGGTGLVFPGLGGGVLDEPVSGAWGHVQSAIAADIDGDGAADLVSTTLGQIQVHRRIGPATFAAPVGVAAVGYPVVLAVADFTGDGLADVLVDLDARDRSVVIAGDGMGGLASVARVAYTGTWVTKQLVTDLDEDGAPDIVDRTTEYASEIRIHRAREDGGFEPWFPYPAALDSMIAADVDRDGDVDLVALEAGDAASAARRYVGVVLGLPGIELAAGARREVAGTGESAIGLAAGDFDADGRLDLIAATLLEVPELAIELAFLGGNGDGTFAVPHPFSLSLDVRGFVVGDFDRDAHLDVAVAASAPRLYRGHGDGTFGPSLAFGPGYEATAILAGDLDGDGYPEAITSGYENSFTVIRGTTGAASTYPGPFLDDTHLADLDRDGALDIVSKGGGMLTVIPGDGAGGFLPPRTFHGLLGPNATLDAMAIADLDHDGGLEIVSGGGIYRQTCLP